MYLKKIYTLYIVQKTFNLESQKKSKLGLVNTKQ
jgi:hypothetical protein